MIRKDYKMVMLTYNHALDDEMLELLEQCGVEGYTKLEGATGTGKSGPHEGTNIWPVTNNIIFTAVTAAQLKLLRSGGKTLSARFPGEGMRGFLFNLEEVW